MDIWVGRVGNKDADESFVRRLREIDPAADVRWVPGSYERGDRWQVGVWYEPLQLQRNAAIYALDREFDKVDMKRNVGRMRFFWDVLRGWRTIMTVNGPMDARVVDDFRQRDWTFRHSFDQVMAEKLDAHLVAEREHEENMSAMVREAFDDHWLYKKMIGHKMVATHGFRDGMPFPRKKVTA